MSAPIDLLSESLASSTSLLSLLMRRNGESGPIASALLSKESRKVDSGDKKKRVRFKRRRPTASTTTKAGDTVTDRSSSSDGQEPLVYACPEPEGCPTPVAGEIYTPFKNKNKQRIRGSYGAKDEGVVEEDKNVLTTIYRQEVVKNRKPIMRVRKKQKKPTRPSAPLIREEGKNLVSDEAVKMITEMIKEAGPVLSHQEMQIIADVSQEVGADVSAQQVEVISMLAEAMGPHLTTNEVDVIAKVASILDEGEPAPSKSTMKIVAELVMTQNGEDMNKAALQRIEQIMKTGSQSVAVGDRGISQHGAQMIAQMMHNLGPDVSSMELKIVSDMIKEIDRDLSKNQAEVMAKVLKVIMPAVNPQVVQEVSVAVNIDEPSMDAQELEDLAATMVTKVSTGVTPQMMELVIEMIQEVGGPAQLDDTTMQLIAEAVGQTSGVQPSDVEAIAHISIMLGEEVVNDLTQSDLAVITTMAQSVEDDKKTTSQRAPPPRQGQVSKEEANFMADVVKLFGDLVAPAEKAELKQQVEKIDPKMTDDEAEVMTQILIEIGPQIKPEAIMEIANAVTDNSVNVNPDNVKEVSDKVAKFSLELTAKEVKMIADMVEKLGPNLSLREMQMIARRGKESGIEDLEMNDIEMVAEIADIIGSISESEAALLAIMSDAMADSKDGDSAQALTEEAADTMANVLANMGEAITDPEVKVINEILKAVDSTMTDKEAEVMAEVIQQLGSKVSVSNLEIIAETVKNSEAIDTGEEVEQIAAIVEEMSKPQGVMEISIVMEMMEKMDTPIDISAGDMVTIARLAKQAGADVTPKDVEAINEIAHKVLDQPLTKGDMAMIELIATVQEQTQADITPKEASSLAEMIKAQGPSITENEVVKIEEMLAEMAPRLSQQKVEVTAKVLAEIGPNVEAITIEEVARLMSENDVDLSTNDVEQVVKMVRNMEHELMTEQVKVVAEMKMVSGPVLSHRDMQETAKKANEAVEEIRSSPIMTTKQVEIISDVMDMLNSEISNDEVELIAIMTKAAGQDISPESSQKSPFGANNEVSTMSKPEAEKLARMIKSLGADMTTREEANLAQMVSQMDAELDDNEASVMIKVLKNIESVVDAELVAEITEMVNEPDVDIDADKVDRVAELAQNLTEKVTPKDLVVVANLASRMGPVITGREMRTIAKLAESSDVSLSMNTIAILTDIAKEVGNEMSDTEAEMIVKLTLQQSSVIDKEEAVEVAQLVADMGSHMSSVEVEDLKDALNKAAPELSENSLDIMTEILQQVGPGVDGATVMEVAKVADEGAQALTPHVVEVVAEMVRDLDLTPEDIEMVVKLVEKSGPRVSPREMQMITRMAQNSGIDIEKDDIENVEVIVHALGPEISQNDLELVAVLAEERNQGAAAAPKEAEKIVNNLQEMDKTVAFEDIQKLETIIQQMEPLMTKSKVQVMSQLLMETRKKVQPEDVMELADIVMEASDDITPGDIIEIAEITRKSNSQLTPREVMVVAEMSEKMGDSLSPREMQMISRMMRSSGLTISMNDIKVVADVIKAMGGHTPSEGDAKLIAKMTQLTPGTEGGRQPVPFERPQVSSLPRRPIISTLPEKPRLNVNIGLKNRIKSRRPPTSYVPAVEDMVEERPEQANDGFGLKQEIPAAAPPTAIPTESISPFPNFPPLSQQPTSRRPLVPRRTVRPNILGQRLTTPTSPTSPVEDSTQLRLEEFLMRRRPTPFRTFPSQSAPVEDQFEFAVRPTSAEIEDLRLPHIPLEVDNAPLLKMPGQSFMRINMGTSSFDSETLREEEEAVDQFQNPNALSKDTLKTMVDTLGFAKDDPQSMLMNFLMKKNLPPSPPSDPIHAAPVMTEQWLERPTTPDPLKGLFNLESTTLDRTPSGNFLHMKMGTENLQGVDPAVLPKLKRNKIDLSEDGNSFMSIHMGDTLLRRVSSYEPSSLPELKRPVRRPVVPHTPRESLERVGNSDPWESEESTPFTVRPTLPVGQVKLWPTFGPTETPFTVRPTKKPFVQIYTKKPLPAASWPTKKPFVQIYTKKPLPAASWTTATPFTVRPSKTPASHNYIHNSPHGVSSSNDYQSHSYVHHDVKLKSPFDSAIGDFTGNKGFIRDEVVNSHPHASTSSYFDNGLSIDDYHGEEEGFDYLEDGYKGIGALNYPGQHDDRPPVKGVAPSSYSSFSTAFKTQQQASFGDLKFNLPTRGIFPDRPLLDNTKVLRDLPTIDQLDYEDEGVGESHNEYGKSYLQNPYGADFIRLEVDSSRYKHNKTRRMGIHHIPLKVHGYAETSEFPVSSDTERPHMPPKRSPQKGLTAGSPHKNTNAIGFPFTAMRDAMENLPNAIQHLPHFMQTLVSNHASWINRAWSTAGDNGMPKSLESLDTDTTESLVVTPT
jgi:hypothetical protein